MIIHRNLSKIKNKILPTFYKETIETVEENLAIRHMACLGLTWFRVSSAK